MKRDNFLILIAGIICAALLWQYYLYPKYNKKVQDPQTMSELLQADRIALDEELANIPGQLLYRSDSAPVVSYENVDISYQEDPEIEKEKITMIKAPAKYEIISSAAEYEKVKKFLALTPEQIDFSKEMLILIESAGNLNDGFFQIKDIQNKQDEIIVSYSFNIIGAKDRVGKISAQKNQKSNLPIVLQQVL